MILKWYKDQFSKELVDPFPDSIPPLPPSVRHIAPPISIEDQVRNGVGAQPAKKRPIRMVEEVKPDEALGPDLSRFVLPLLALEVTNADVEAVFSPQKKRHVAQQVDSSKSDMEGEGAPPIP
ncbi:unnamed protein product [Calypogeia fissa]